MHFLNNIHKILLDSVRGENKESEKIRNIQNWIGPKGCTMEEPILFLSEIIELYKPSYHKFLNESRKGNMLGFIKFFLQCIIEQCNSNIAKINRIQKIYEEDMKLIEKLSSNAIYRIMPAIIHQIVFTKKEIEEESGVSRNTVSTLIDKLEELGILVKDSTYAKLGYRYNKIYNVFVGKESL